VYVLEAMDSTKIWPDGRISVSEMSLTKPFKCSGLKDLNITLPFFMP
jgi:hypothetical protein